MCEIGVQPRQATGYKKLFRFIVRAKVKKKKKMGQEKTLRVFA